MTVADRAYSRRTGTIIPLLAVCIVALMAFCALAVDLGVVMVARTECQNAADTAALTGCRTLDNKVPTGTPPLSYDNQKANAELNARNAIKTNILMTSQFTDAKVSEIRVGYYAYDTLAALPTFKPDFTETVRTDPNKSWTAVRATVTGDQPTFFAKVFGITTMPTGATAVAVHRPRDVAMVLDFTGSMGYGSIPNHNAKQLNSSDPVFARFGHYQRFDAYNPANPGGSATGAVASRPHPLYNTATVISAPYVYAPANLTVQTANGPAIVKDFYYDTGNTSDPSVPDLSANPASFRNAFHCQTFSTAANARTLGDTGPTPAPASWALQNDDVVVYDGDKYPRKYGYEAPSGGADWNPTTTNGAAVSLAEYLGWSSRYTSGASLPSITFPTGRNISNFRDATWERYGYDLDVAHYIANRNTGTTWDPRFDAGRPRDNNNTTPNPPTASRYDPVVTPGKFKGYSMGPGYWGKTFFMWPPDPRQNWDWRRRFFLKGDGTPFDTEVDDIDTLLFTSGTGLTLRAASATTYSVNYPAILSWIKSGPQVFPPNLRAGRVLYYSSIPDNVTSVTGETDKNLDKAFWKAYIDAMLRGGTTETAGQEGRGWPEGVTPSIASTPTAYDPDGGLSSYVDPKPYSTYLDNPSRPRLDFWFGPLTMTAFIANRGMLAGSMHEAQCWQLKAGVNSALDDMKANHPNDSVGMTFFSNNQYKGIMVHMGQDWASLKNSLFFPKTLLTQISTNASVEIRPYDTSMVYTGNGNIPNSQGSTDPNTGLAYAFNLLANSPNVNADVSRRGRRGANKIVIFETDGVPNSVQNMTLVKRGWESYYSASGSVTATPEQAAYDVVDQIVKPTANDKNANSDSGHSTVSSPARVYSIGFGDIFNTSAGPTAAGFLLNIQKRGNTSADTEAALPTYQIITGDYDTRITNLRTALERIMQSGIQVTLIE